MQSNDVWRPRRSLFTNVSFLLLLTASLCPAAGPSLDTASELYQLTRYEEALGVLQKIASKDAAYWTLTGKSYYGSGEYKRAAEALEKATALRPEDSTLYMWLGRVYGRRAETSSFLTAPLYASRARQYFEKSIQLDPRNLEAMDDLLDYYLDAPGFLGGGLDKAQSLAERIGALDPAEFHYAQARIAEKRHDPHSAEQHYRKAYELSPRRVGRLLDLGTFYSGQGRYRESDEAFRLAAQSAPGLPKVIFARAKACVRAKRNLEEARSLLQKYLQSNLTPDDAPRQEAVLLLRAASGG